MCKYTYYEIMDAFPHVLRSDIPIFYILKIFLYVTAVIFMFFISFFNLKKMNHLLFHKNFELNGRMKENADYVSIDNKSFLFPDKEVSRTDIHDFNKKNSIKLLESLKKSNPEYDFQPISNSFHIRKRIEYIVNDSSDKTFILFSFPKIATKISNLIKG